MIRLLGVFAVIGLFAWLTGRALDQEFATGSPARVEIGTAILAEDGLTREYGDGLIRVNRAGPEKWRWRYVLERRRADALQRRLTKRVKEVRSLQTAARSTLRYPTGHWLDGAFLCIHRHERGAAGWQTDTGNGYRGGLQMDWSFSNAYADDWVYRTFGRNPANWPASVQITAAIHAWTSRGFGPWPNTRKPCGL